MNKDIFHLGVVTSFIYTVIYVAKNNIIVECEYIKNISFQKEICDKLDVVFAKYTIDFISLFTGPAPLMSCRTTLIFMQATCIALNMPIVLLSGNNYYRYKYCDVVIIQNFCGNYVLIENNKKQEKTTLLEIEKKDYSNKIVGLVSREGHNIIINSNYIVLLFPNLDNIVKDAYKKYQNNRLIKKFNQIVPFF
jgi:hypothetical protein